MSKVAWHVYRLGPKLSFWLSAAAVLSLLAAGCGKAPVGKSERSRSGSSLENVLTFAIGNDLSNMDPALITDIESAFVASQVYQGLLKFKAGSVEVEPDLAEKYTTSEDGLTWTFHLRDGIRFHDGTPFNSQAVVFSIMRQIDKNHPAHVPGKMEYAHFLFGDRSTTGSMIVADVVAPDPRTVVFKLAKAYQPFSKNLAMSPASIVSPAAVTSLKADFNTTMVGTGPFRLQSVQRDSQVSLIRNPDFRGKSPDLEQIRIRILRNSNTRLGSLQKGESDVITGVEPTALPALKQDPGLEVLSEPSMNLGYLLLNNKRAPFDNRLVRLALNHAVDRQSIVDKLFSETSIIAKGIIPPGMLGYNADLPGYEFNPEKAKRLLAEAGFPNGLEVEFLTHNSARIYNPAGAKLAEKIQQDLAAVGIKAKITEMEFPAFLERTRASDFQMANSGWVTDNGDPDNFIYELAGREDNNSNYTNPEATALMRQAACDPDDNKRAALYQQTEKMFAENPPFVPLNHAKQIMAKRKRVKNLKLHPTGVTQLAEVSVE